METANTPADSFERAERIVKNDVLVCLSTLISELAQKEEYMEDLMPVLSQTVWVCSGCGFSNADESELEECCDAARAGETDVEEEVSEALEHWAVSSWLASKLEGQGEMVTEFMGLKVWGRTTSGQAIALDGVMQAIAKHAGMV